MVGTLQVMNLAGDFDEAGQGGKRALPLRVLAQFLHQGDIVQHTDSMGAADLLDRQRAKGRVSRTKNIGLTNDGGLKNGIVVRIAHDGRNFRRQSHPQRGLFEQGEVRLDWISA